MRRKIKFSLIALSIVLFFAANVDAKGGLLGLGVNTICHAPGALITASGFLADSTIWMSEKVCGAGVTCANLTVSGANHVKKDPPGALGTAGKAVLDTAWGGISGLWCVAFGK